MKKVYLTNSGNLLEVKTGEIKGSWVTCGDDHWLNLVQDGLLEILLENCEYLGEL